MISMAESVIESEESGARKENDLLKRLISEELGKQQLRKKVLA